MATLCASCPASGCRGRSRDTKGHQWTLFRCPLVSHLVAVKIQSGRGASARFSEAEWLKNQVKVA